MANITLRQSSGNTEPRLANVSISNTPLTNVQLDNNFNNLNNDVNSRLSKSGGEVTGNLTISGNTIINSATVSEVHTNDLDLQAVSTTLHRSPNAIKAMFIYDVAKTDSDGGAWTEKCQHTSWYNETIYGKWLGAQDSEANARNSGAFLGAELITNGNLGNGTTGWTAFQATLSVSSGSLDITATAVGTVAAYQTISGLVPGRAYLISIGQVTLNGRVGSLAAYDSPPASSNLHSGLTSSNKSTQFIAPSDGTVSIAFVYTSTEVGQIVSVNNISVKEVTATTTAANDYFQLTSDGKFYALSKNLLTSTATLATQTQWLTAGTYTLSSTTGSSGSVAISGAATASHTAGTPTTFTVATSGNVTFTVTGSVLTAQCELGSVATTYSANASTTRYNEVFRGNKRSFPKVAAIVAEASNVNIYDLTEPGRPMWMRFTSNSGSEKTMLPTFPNTSLSCLSCLNAILMVGNDTYDLARINFISDTATRYSTGTLSTSFGFGISLRNSEINKYIKTNLPGIASRAVNAVAMTVLPDAPVDHCLVGSTLVSMADGSYKRIDEVVVGDLVNTLEGVSTVKRWLDQGIKNTITLTFDNGTTLTCTPDHQIHTTIGWVEAQNLTDEHEIIHE